MKPNTISLKELIGRIKRHPLLTSLSDDSIIDYTVDLIRILGIPQLFSEKLAEVTIENGRGALPDDFIDVIQVRLVASESKVIYFRSMTDNFYQSDKRHLYADYQYKIQGSVIYTYPVTSGTLEVAYKAIEVDDCGMPLVPDNAKFIRALEAYIKQQYFTILFDIGQINIHALNNAQQEYCWAIGACQTEFKMPTLDEMESISNVINSMLPDGMTHNTGYATAGDREVRWVK